MTAPAVPAPLRADPPAPTPATPGPRTPSTATLVRAACAGDRRAWAEVVHRYSGMVHAVVGSYRLSEADAADAVQNTWLRALERLDTVREPDRLGGWLATTARRECLAVLRLHAREVPGGLLDLDVPAVTPGPEAHAMSEEVHRLVRRAVAELPVRRRDLMVALFGTPDTHYSEVSRVLDLPPGSIGPTRGRVLRTLRGTLERGGLDAECVA